MLSKIDFKAPEGLLALILYCNFIFTSITMSKVVIMYLLFVDTLSSYILNYTNVNLFDINRIIHKYKTLRIHHCKNNIILSSSLQTEIEIGT